MKERPILFSGAMVRAILEGRKTVTRRAMRIQPVLKGHFWEVYGAGWSDGMDYVPCVYGHSLAVACPYGQVGERLWVRESFADLQGTGIEHRPDPAGPLQRYAFAADSPPGSASDEARKDFGIKWKPSIHMPRAVCRILLEITGLRVERLQVITTEQLIAEGLQTRLREHDAECDLQHQWKELWVSLNGQESWDANPWVWAVEFKRIEA